MLLEYCGLFTLHILNFMYHKIFEIMFNFERIFGNVAENSKKFFYKILFEF